MASAELTSAQREILRQLHTIIETDRLERIWLFAPHIGTARESGLFVLSLYSDSRMGGEMRELLTLRYTVQQQGSKPVLERSILSEGWAPPNRIERVMVGVLARAGNDAGNAREEVIGDGERWEDLLYRIDPPG